jgi:hypothetical protein
MEQTDVITWDPVEEFASYKWLKNIQEKSYLNAECTKQEVRQKKKKPTGLSSQAN